VLIFVLLCRSLGLDTRIVLNFDISPLKPTNDDLVAALGSAKSQGKSQKVPNHPRFQQDFSPRIWMVLAGFTVE
jgi:hypothetical protein